jgi:hypothetical protein
MPGNIHFGFVGRAAGFSGEALHLGAGYAEIIDPAHKDRGEACCPQYCLYWPDAVCIELGCYYFNPEWIKYFFDDPEDYQSVEFGIKLFNQHGKNLSFGQFQTFLTNHRSMLKMGVPRPEPWWEQVSADPYPYHHFDAPATKKNAPIVNLLLAWPLSHIW